MSKKRSRGFCFTINNYTDKDIDDCMALGDYCIIGKEIGEEGTPHLQGFCYFKQKCSFKKIKSLIPRAHIEKQKGTLAQAIEYCMKDEMYEEYGTRPRQGRRTDLDIIKYDIKKGVSEKTIANNYFSQWCQYRRAFREYRELVVHETTVIFYDDHDFNSVKAAAEYPGYQVQDNDNILMIYCKKQYDWILCPKTHYLWDQRKNLIYKIV